MDTDPAPRKHSPRPGLLADARSPVTVLLALVTLLHVIACAVALGVG